MSNGGWKGEDKFHLWGWILFVVCAGFFIASNIEVGDPLGLAGSIIFFIACGVFIIPLVVRRKSG
jgi:hypothetical protein